MKTSVLRPCGKSYEVKNLGWLRRHASEVVELVLFDRRDGARCGCGLSALLADGTIYKTAFNSLEICRQWIRRPSLRHAAVRDTVTQFSSSNP